MCLEVLNKMGDGFWGALIGALITGTAGIVVITIQFCEKRSALKRESNKEIKYFVYFAEKFLECFTDVISNRDDLNRNLEKINGERIADVSDQGVPEYEEVILDKDENIEVLQRINHNIETSILPSALKRCENMILSIKEINLNIVNYNDFERVLNTLYLIEKTTAYEYTKGSIDKLIRTQLEIKSEISILKIKL